MTAFKSGCEAVWLPTSLDLSRSVGESALHSHTPHRRNKLQFFFFYRDVGCNHPPDVWIYGLVIPLWSNLAGTSAA